MNTARTLFIALLAVALFALPAVAGQKSQKGGDRSWKQTGSLIVARQQHTATLLPDGRVLVAGGLNCTQNGLCVPLASAEVYDPGSGTWSPTGDMGFSRPDHTAILLPAGKVLVTGGYACLSSDCDSRTRSAELYDPATGTWSPTGSLAVARIWHTLTLLTTGQVLAAGGTTRDAELYDPATGTWSPTGSMTTSQASPSATLLASGEVLMAGGFACNELGGNCYEIATAQRYDPASGTWTRVGDMSSVRIYHTATLLPDGRVLAVGGHASAESFGTAELYDPDTGTWSPAKSMWSTRSYHTATLLTKGDVLVAGGLGAGVDGVYYFLDSAEVYKPSPAKWVQTQTMSVRRASHTATLLLDGGVLVTGGQLGNDSVANADLYRSR